MQCFLFFFLKKRQARKKEMKTQKEPFFFFFFFVGKGYTRESPRLESILTQEIQIWIYFSFVFVLLGSLNFCFSFRSVLGLVDPERDSRSLLSLFVVFARILPESRMDGWSLSSDKEP